MRMRIQVLADHMIVLFAQSSAGRDVAVQTGLGLDCLCNSKSVQCSGVCIIILVSHLIQYYLLSLTLYRVCYRLASRQLAVTTYYQTSSQHTHKCGPFGWVRCRR